MALTDEKASESEEDVDEKASDSVADAELAELHSGMLMLSMGDIPPKQLSAVKEIRSYLDQVVGALVKLRDEHASGEHVTPLYINKCANDVSVPWTGTASKRAIAQRKISAQAARDKAVNEINKAMEQVSIIADELATAMHRKYLLEHMQDIWVARKEVEAAMHKRRNNVRAQVENFRLENNPALARKNKHIKKSIKKREAAGGAIPAHLYDSFPSVPRD